MAICQITSQSGFGEQLILTRSSSKRSRRVIIEVSIKDSPVLRSVEGGIEKNAINDKVDLKWKEKGGAGTGFVNSSLMGFSS